MPASTTIAITPASAATSIVAGDRDPDIPELGHDEFGDLARRLGNMAGELGEREAALAGEYEEHQELLLAVLPPRLIDESGHVSESGDLADLVTVVDVSAAAALENILGAASEAVALDSAEFLPGIVAKMGERQLGRAVFQVEAPPASRAGSAAPGWLRPATSAVQAKAPEHARLVANLFARLRVFDALRIGRCLWLHDSSGFSGLGSDHKL